MTRNEQTLLPGVVVSLHSPRWIAAVQRAAQGTDKVSLHWQASIRDAFAAAAAHSGCAVIVEWQHSPHPDRIVELMASFSNNPHRALLFILGDESHESSPDFLGPAFAADCATSILEFDLLWSRVVRHLRNHQISGLSVEELVEARFPFS